MSFLKITDPKKRYFIVSEFLKIRQNIQQNFLSEGGGDWSTQHELSKAFQTSYRHATIVKRRSCKRIETNQRRNEKQNLRKAITFPQFPSITAYDDDGEEEEDVFIGDIAEEYLRKFAIVSGADKTFGLRDKDGRFYIGNKEAKLRITI